MADESAKKQPFIIRLEGPFVFPDPPKVISGKIKYNLHRIDDNREVESDWFAQDEEAPEGFEYYGDLEKFPTKALRDPKGYAARKGWAEWYRDWFAKEINSLKKTNPLLPNLVETAKAFEALKPLPDLDAYLRKQARDAAATFDSFQQIARPLAIESARHEREIKAFAERIATIAKPNVEFQNLAAFPAWQDSSAQFKAFSQLGWEMKQRLAEIEPGWKDLSAQLKAFGQLGLDTSLRIAEAQARLLRGLNIPGLQFDPSQLRFEQTRQNDQRRFQSAILVLSDPNPSEEEKYEALEELKRQRKQLLHHCGRIGDYLIEAGDNDDWPTVFRGFHIIAEENGWRPPIPQLGEANPAHTLSTSEPEQPDTLELPLEKFDPRRINAGERGKAIAIAFSVRKSNVRDSHLIAKTLDRAYRADRGQRENPLITKNRNRFKNALQWAKNDPDQFYKFLSRLRSEARKKGVYGLIPAKYYTRYRRP